MLGQTYQSVGEYEQASRVYKNLGKVNPGNSVARERLALCKNYAPAARNLKGKLRKKSSACTN